MESTASCLCCAIATELEANGALFQLGEHWTINARIGHERPALVVQSRVHREGISDLLIPEREDLGRVLSVATGLLEQVPGVERVYTCLWNENSPGHVHFHLIPRFGSDRGAVLGSQLADIKPPEWRGDMDEIAERTSIIASRVRIERSQSVQLVLGACRTWSRISLYRLFSGIKGGEGRFDGAEKYVFSWLTLWVLLFTICGISSNLRGQVWLLVAPFLGVCSYRILDIFLFEARIILQPTDFKSIPRGLLLRVLNLVEVMLCIAVLLQVRSGLPPAHSALEGFRAATLQANFSQPGLFADGVLVLGSAVSLTLLAGGVAVLLSKVGEQVREIKSE